jgi:hypothetical protein
MLNIVIFLSAIYTVVFAGVCTIALIARRSTRQGG